MRKTDKEDCTIYYDSEFVSWVINKNNIEDTLLGNKENKHDGLLFLNVESAGEIEFKDTTCKINKKSEKLCNKTMSSSLKFKKGNNDSVYTPLAVVNFHTHPLNCYIDAQTIWGWPSGEDLAQCMNFANDNNVTHVIFAVEGTYVIDVNKFIINTLKTNDKTFIKLRKNIEEIFKLSHKHRMVINENNIKTPLEVELNEIFLKPLDLQVEHPHRENILLLWLRVINNLTIRNLIILSDEFSKYFKQISKLSVEPYFEKYLDIKIFSVVFFKNSTIQWDNSLSKKEIFEKLKKSNKKFNIGLPNKIEYKAPFISDKCKL